MLKPLALLGWVLILGRDVYIVSVTKKKRGVGGVGWHKVRGLVPWGTKYSRKRSLYYYIILIRLLWFNSRSFLNIACPPFSFAHCSSWLFISRYVGTARAATPSPLLHGLSDLERRGAVR